MKCYINCEDNFYNTLNIRVYIAKVKRSDMNFKILSNHLAYIGFVSQNNRKVHEQKCNRNLNNQFLW